MSSNCAFQRTKIFRLNSKECLGTVFFLCLVFSFALSVCTLFALALLFVYVNVDFLKECRAAEANFRLTLFFHFFSSRFNLLFSNFVYIFLSSPFLCTTTCIDCFFMLPKNVWILNSNIIKFYCCAFSTQIMALFFSI